MGRHTASCAVPSRHWAFHVPLVNIELLKATSSEAALIEKHFWEISNTQRLVSNKRKGHGLVQLCPITKPSGNSVCHT